MGKGNKNTKEFNAKLLLFGEYSIICNSMGLSVPYAAYKGKLSFSEEATEFVGNSNKSLKAFYNYLSDLYKDSLFNASFDFESFSHDLNKGLYFESNIPQGFGVGSSGALVAAIYDRYALNKISRTGRTSKKNMQKLKDVFSQMESFFHGRSSGIDPLNCYLKKPLLIKNIKDINKIGLPIGSGQEKGGMFLIDTGQIGHTEPLVKYFLEQCENNDFYKSLQQEMIPANDNCIKSYVKGEMYEFYTNIKKLSKYLLHNFGPMIPEPFIEIWKKGLESSAYYLKLCGSGGGGYLLGFAQDLEYAKIELEKLQVKIIPVPVETEEAQKKK